MAQKPTLTDQQIRDALRFAQKHCVNLKEGEGDVVGMGSVVIAHFKCEGGEIVFTQTRHQEVFSLLTGDDFQNGLDAGIIPYDVSKLTLVA